MENSSYKSNTEFEKIFQEFRKKEQRFYSDAQVKVLPRAFTFNPHKNEWKYRAILVTRFLKYLQKSSHITTILEIGCGNGWLCHKISNTFQREVYGLDTMRIHLDQAKRVFKKPNLTFIHGDIFDDVLPHKDFDLIVINNTIQYYPNLRQLIERSQLFLRPEGELHIMDSPIYKFHEIESAKLATRNYYESIHCEEMIPFHHHHSWDDFYPFKYKVLFDPQNTINSFRKSLGHVLPEYPWIRIRKEM